jgi:hypothetical protein
MPEQRLHELLVELEANLKGASSLSEADRALLRRLHGDLSAALRAKPPRPAPQSVREGMRDSIERLQIEHPRISGLLRAALDALSDLGV